MLPKTVSLKQWQVFMSRSNIARSVRCMSQLPPPDLPKLAEMARIGATSDELKEWKPQVEEIIAWFDQLQAVDLDDVSPQLRAIQNTEVSKLRRDESEDYPNVDALMKQIPDKENGFLKVPKIGS